MVADTTIATCRAGQLELRIWANRRAVTRIDLIPSRPDNGSVTAYRNKDNGDITTEYKDNTATPAALAVRQLDEYFSGARRVFDFPIELYGTPFRLRVWRALTTIGYGEIMSYGELARRIGQPKAARAVGGAAHNNPVPIAVPCHRLVGSDGSLTGFACGTDTKAYLLRLEAETAAMQG
ncbi:MAG TPA: methylated-DNA--[protein]-cysteine S-methyltransferase [Firmicutes bacterium]|nr:methylated-DNA--[protein]-cysteine S-methyltransferase [Bacillota bacterium]